MVKELHYSQTLLVEEHELKDILAEEYDVPAEQFFIQPTWSELGKFENFVYGYRIEIDETDIVSILAEKFKVATKDIFIEPKTNLSGQYLGVRTSVNQKLTRYSYRCDCCNERLKDLKRIKFCPYCGTKIIFPEEMNDG